MSRPAKKQKVERRPVEWEHTDAICWDPTALVDKHVRVFWPSENRFYSGIIVKHLSTTFQHEIHYADGDEEVLVLAMEKIQLRPECMCELPPPSSAYLAALARHLDSLGDRLERKAVEQQTARGRTMLKEDERKQLELLRRRAADVRTARERLEFRCMKQRQQQPMITEQRQAHTRETPKGANTSHDHGPHATAAPRSRSQRATAAGATPAAVAAFSGKPAPGPALTQRQQPSMSLIPAGACVRAAEASQEPAMPDPSPADAQAAEQHPEVAKDHLAAPLEATPFRVCSPASAKRRQRMLQSSQQDKAQHRGRRNSIKDTDSLGLNQAGGMAPGAAPLGTPPLPVCPSVISTGRQLRSQQQPPSGQQTGAMAWMGSDSRGVQGSRGLRVAEADIGKLYVPRPWPKLQVTTPDGAPAGETGRKRKGTGAEQRVAEGRPAAKMAAEAAVPSGSAQLEQQPYAPAGERDMAAGACSNANGKGAGPARGSASGDERCRLDAAGSELQEAYKHFRLHCSGFKQYHEMQVMLWLSPQQLVGRELRVLWPDEQAWFCGRVTRYDADAGTHTVEYDDGDVEHLHLAAEELRLQLIPGAAEAALAPQPPEALQQAGECLLAAAARVRQRMTELQRGEIPHGKEGQEAEEEVKELAAKAERWSSRAAQLRALVAAMLREAPTDSRAVAPCGAGQGPAVLPSQSHQTPVLSANAPAHDAATGDACTAAIDAMAGDPRTVEPVLIATVPATATPPPVAVAAATLPPCSASLGSIPAIITEAGAAEAEAAGPDAVEEQPQLPADWATTQVLRPGEVVWAQVRRSAPWPAIVITREEAEREGFNPPRVGSSSSAQPVYVRFFGDHTVYGLPAVAAGQRIPDRGGVLPFLAGLELGWHVRKGGGSGGAAGGAAAGSVGGSGSAQAQRFLRALFELRTYLRDGELPRGMIPPNYDDDEDEEAEDAGGDGIAQEEPAAPGATAAGGASAGHKGDRDQCRTATANNKLGQTNAADPLTASRVTFPFVVGPKLRLLRLGEVVWLSRWFHDEKYIYPLGYTAARVMASGASGGREVQHLMEIAATDDGVRPVFRITPQGHPPVCADTASRAMRALFKDDARTSGRAFAKTGADLFGLTNPRVAALVRSLPGAERCEAFANWPDQEKLPVPPLTPYEELQRQALYARALRLPAGVTAVPQTKTGMCFECEVCGEDEESPGDLKLECDMCRCVVHSRCYGAQPPPRQGSMWLCDVCQLHAAGLPADRSPPCALCPVAGGPMKRTDTGGYVHLLCAVWTPGVTFGDPEKLTPVEGVAKAVQNRSSLKCYLCKQPHGACIQCAGDARCYRSFHPMCAREAGLAMCELRLGAAARKRPTGRSAAAACRGASRRTQASDPQQAAVGRQGQDDKQLGAASREVNGSVVTCALQPAERQEEGGKENKHPCGAVNAQLTTGPMGGEATEGDATAAAILNGTSCSGTTVVGLSSQPPQQQQQQAAGNATACVAVAPVEPHAATAAITMPTPAAMAAAEAVLLPPRRGRGRPPKEAPAAGPIGHGAAPPGSARPAALAAALCRGGGVSLADGTSLACFCQRHEELVLHHTQFRCSYPGGRFASRRAGLAREELLGRRRQQQEEQRQQLERQQEQQRREAEVLAAASRPEVHADMPAAAAAGGRVAVAAGHAAPGAARAVSFANWRSRGHRAPEAVAIAREKRTYVRQLPYLVTGRLQLDDEAVQTVAYGTVCRTAEVQTHLEGKATKVQSCVRGAAGSAADVHASAARAVPVSNSLPATGCKAQSGIAGSGCTGGAGVDNGGSSSVDGDQALAGRLAAAASTVGARSVAERYAAMRATVGRRLAAGKSAIHGWGAFAKVPHKRGDMLIEYAGELIRPSVSDVREKRLYDKLVGCGTYIFNLNEEQHIDATRAGNMAHLLNHSCDPNCYSRTITLWDAATGATKDHVIIMAKRDIAAWEELTYDYRFNSAEELPCNCGAATCRLLVNWPEEQQEEAVEEEEEEGSDEGEEVVE
ncbi:hypothetical protein Agub_g1354 [Astrephomene gubernaculifera]|uniref:Histone-lysine N-methyltransferase n=1 Tax=Astrephomene gubernaculifera TaxID=47775 RepID=A0AAD3HGR8_9CHLO|nr:hypothetical protein Agub_g1354 [Astrephomene gubernaculifera]